MDQQQYDKLVKQAAPRSPKLKNCLWAFGVGGALCAWGEVAYQLIAMTGMEDKTARMLASSTLILLSATLTVLRIFDSLAKHAGAGTLVPITGFANAIVSNAMEFRTEGLIFGTGVKLFTIAGPVIVYGVSASVLYGFIYWVTTLF